MSYAQEREYSPAQKVAVIVEYLTMYGSLTAEEAAKEAGCSHRRAHEILSDLEGVLYLERQYEGEPQRKPQRGQKPIRFVYYMDGGKI